MAVRVRPDKAALAKFLIDFDKSFGADTRSGSGWDSLHDVIPTGSIALDYALGCGGLIKGRLVELWGPEQMGKSTQMMITMAQAQRLNPDKMQAWIDVEKTWDPNWAALHGVDLDRVLVAQPDNAEDVADIAKELVTSGLINMLTLDSVGAMIGAVEKEKDAHEATVAVVAKVVTRMVKLMAAEAPRYKVAVAVINQVRANISANGPRAAQTTRTGGFALGHVTTHRLNFRRGPETYKIGTKTDSKNDQVQVGQQVAILVEKNKVAPPKRTAMLTYFNQQTDKYGSVGIDQSFDAFTMGNQLNIFARNGSHYTLPNGEKVNGKDAALAYISEHPEVIKTIREKVLATLTHEVIVNSLEEG